MTDIDSVFNKAESYMPKELIWALDIIHAAVIEKFNQGFSGGVIPTAITFVDLAVKEGLSSEDKRALAVVRTSILNTVST